MLYYNITFLSQFHRYYTLSQNKVISPFKSERHAHSECLKSAMDAAKARCAASGMRLTSLRQRVLELVWQNHEPVKAYDILDALKQDSTASAPPTVYRALDFLQQQGLVHKIESLNAYIGCGDPSEAHSSQFFICQNCSAVAELDDADIRILFGTKANELGFSIDREHIEIKGYCHACLEEKETAHG